MFNYVVLCYFFGRFEDHKEVLKAAYSIIRSHFNGAWIRWSHVPVSTRDFWFEEFEV